ncbi:MAG: rhamnogalacturonan acetylesterase [Ferruginibacter sp.]|nr:rhamnogalacturonan acetylesterase [Ferruginibacter sp.]
MGALGLIIMMSFLLPDQKKTTVWLIGDSTMCLYEPSRAPLTGWGMPFANFFDSTVRIANMAKGGRSTRTFLGENRWQPIVDSLTEGDYVFIQFGHNDEAKEEKYKDRYTPVADYKVNLEKFIKESRAKKAIPVLITPVTRMRFDKAGHMEETHKEYTAAVWEVGKKTSTSVIDLDEKSRKLLEQMGVADAKLLYMQLDSLEHPHYPTGQKDNTHFNEYGARRIAELVLEGIRELHLSIEKQVIAPKAKK